MTEKTDVQVSESIIERGRRARFFINEAGEEPGEARITDETIMRASVAFGQMEHNGWLKISPRDRDWDLDEPHCVAVIAANFTDAAPSTPQRAKLFAATLAATRSNEARDRLIDDMTVSRAHLVGLLRDAQAQRDRLANETLKLEDRATKAELRLTALETDHGDTDGEETRTFQLWSALGYGCYGRGCTTCFCECQEPDHMAKLLDGAVKDLETLLASPIPVQSRREELLRRPAAALDAVRAERERQVKLRGAENKARTSA